MSEGRTTVERLAESAKPATRRQDKHKVALPYLASAEQFAAVVKFAGRGATFVFDQRPGGLIAFDFVKMRPLVVAVRLALGLELS